MPDNSDDRFGGGVYRRGSSRYGTIMNSKLPPLPPLPSDVDSEILMMDIDDFLLDLADSEEELKRARTAVIDFVEGNVEAIIADNAPLKLDDAVCLPELGGVLTVDRQYSTPSPSLTVKGLRNAISRGDLPTVRPNAKNLYVTRKDVREWLERCRDQESPLASGSAPLAKTSGVMSRTSLSGSSKTPTPPPSAQDAAQRILQELRGSSTNTSRKSTPKT